MALLIRQIGRFASAKHGRGAIRGHPTPPTRLVWLGQLSQINQLLALVSSSGLAARGLSAR
jgi:hypothetical protein